MEVLITYLEMTSKPKTMRLEVPEGVTVARVHQPAPDLYRHLYKSVGQDYRWTDRSSWSDHQLREALHDPGIELNLLRYQDRPAGYSELDFRQPGQAQLAYFGLLPNFLGLGLGRYLLSWTIERAWCEPIERLWVHTCSLDHPRALMVYQKAGFIVYKTEVREHSPAKSPPHDS